MNKTPAIRNKEIDLWTDKQIALLKKHYPTKENKIVAAKIGKSISAIRAKATLLKIKKAKRYWDKATSEKFLLKNWDILSPEEIGEKLGKTKWAVINKYRELKGLR